MPAPAPDRLKRAGIARAEDNLAPDASIDAGRLLFRFFGESVIKHWHDEHNEQKTQANPDR